MSATGSADGLLARHGGVVDLLLPDAAELAALTASPEAALRAGCAAGAEAVSRRGARPPARRRA